MTIPVMKGLIEKNAKLAIMLDRNTGHNVHRNNNWYLFSHHNHLQNLFAISLLWDLIHETEKMVLLCRGKRGI